MIKTRFPLSPYFFGVLSLLLIGGLVIIRLAATVVYNLQTRNMPTAESLILDPYQQTVAQKTDPQELARTGSGLLKKGLPRYAALNFARASELDSNYRDAAYGWAYALFKAKQPNLTTQDRQEINTALDRAERIDPFYRPTIELKQLMAELEKKPDAAQALADRLHLLQQ